MVGLGHGEAARQVEPRGFGEVALVMALGTELLNGTGEEPELHAELHPQAEVVVGQHLQRREERWQVAATADLDWQSESAHSPIRQLAAPRQDKRAIRLATRKGDLGEVRG